MNSPERVPARLGTIEPTAPADPPATLPGTKTPLLKKLTKRHKHMLALKMQGVPRDEIGSLCSCTPEYVSMLAQQPLAKEYMHGLQAEIDSRLTGLFSRSVDAIADALATSKPDDTRLKAARLQLQAIGKFNESAPPSRSAEDIVALILQNNGGLVQVNVSQQPDVQNLNDSED